MFLYPWNDEGRAWFHAGDDHWADRAGQLFKAEQARVKDETPAADDRTAP